MQLQERRKSPIKLENATIWFWPPFRDIFNGSCLLRLNRHEVSGSEHTPVGELALSLNYLLMPSHVGGVSTLVSKNNSSSMHFETHSVVGVGAVIGEVSHGCVLSVAWGVQAFWGSSGHVVEDEPEARLLVDAKGTQRHLILLEKKKILTQIMEMKTTGALVYRAGGSGFCLPTKGMWTFSSSERDPLTLKWTWSVPHLTCIVAECSFMWE